MASLTLSVDFYPEVVVESCHIQDDMVERRILCEAGERFREIFPGLVNWAPSQGITNTVMPSRHPDKLYAVWEELEAGSQHPGGECFQGAVIRVCRGRWSTMQRTTGAPRR